MSVHSLWASIQVPVLCMFYAVRQEEEKGNEKKQMGGYNRNNKQRGRGGNTRRINGEIEN